MRTSRWHEPRVLQRRSTRARGKRGRKRKTAAQEAEEPEPEPGPEVAWTIDVPVWRAPVAQMI